MIRVTHSLKTPDSADEISNTPSGTISSTNVQDALNELDGDIVALDSSLGTAAVEDVGTSGHTLPFLDGTNTWSAEQTLPSIRLTSTTDASLSSTDHAFQIGSSGGTNIIAGVNEIQARNNGAASTLNLNVDGGNVSIGSSSILSILGGQILFPATQNASSDANTLDDYEEGSWTPTIAFAGASVGLTYGTRAGRYVKIGQLVIAAYDVALTAKGSSTGNAVVGSLPFTSLNDGQIGSMTISFYSGMSGLTGSVTGYVNLNASTGQFVQSGASGTANLDNTNFTNTSRLVGTAIYRAA